MGNSISVVIVSYNTKDITDKCLNCIGDQAEVIVVDNASTDGSVEMIRRKYPKVKLLAQKTNTGFTGGNNIGMQASSGDYILLLNSDAFLEKDTLRKCLDYMQTNPRCDVLGCRLTFADGSFQPSAGYLPNPINTFLWVWGVDVLPVFKHLIPSVHPQQAAFFTARQVGWVTGAFMFMKRPVYEKTRGFDEKFFMYMEEVDWCKRIDQAGFQVWYTPNFSVVHLQGASNKFDMSRGLVREMQGLVYYFNKHYRYISGLMKLVIWWGNLARIVAFTVVGKPERADVYRTIIKAL